MYCVTREFTFCYGHRLFGYEGKCRSLHGHNARVRVTLSVPELNSQGMVMDFTELKAIVGDWIDANWDHRMILFRGDPMVKLLSDENEPLFIAEQNPTAEYLAQLLFEIVAKKGFPITRVDFWETAKCFASYGK